MIQRSSATIRRRALVARLSVLLALLVTLTLSACGGDAAATERSAEETAVASRQQPHEAHSAHVRQDADAGQAAVQHAHGDHASGDEHNDPDGHGAHQHAEPLAAGPLPGTSLFHLTSAFTDQHGQPLALGDLRGAPSVVVMFYGDCDTACPLLVRSAEEIERALPPELRTETNFVMVSFDTARDTPERLLAYAREKNLDRDGWRWLVGSEFQTRQLATLLGVQYRDAGNGVFAHSNLVTVLDADGVPTARLEGLGVALEPAVAAVRAGKTVR